MKHDISWFFKSKFDGLKTKATLTEIVATLNGWLPKEVNSSSYSWDDLYKIHCIFNGVFKEGKQKNKIDYFKTREDEYIFYLVELDGEIQQNKLGVDPTHYKSLEKAKDWRNKIIKVIHPDKSTHKNSTKASEILNSLYSDMQKNGK